MHGCYFVFFPRLVCRMSTEEIKRKRLSVLAATICVAGVGVSAGLAAALLIFFRCYGWDVQSWGLKHSAKPHGKKEKSSPLRCVFQIAHSSVAVLCYCKQ